MIFRSFFDHESYTYSYLLARATGRHAVLIDPVLEHTDLYLTMLDELDLHLDTAIDTHIHADHISALGELRNSTGCKTRMGREANVKCVSQSFHDNEVIDVDHLLIKALHTPGHTPESYCLLYNEYLFTGDTLLIRGSGRTDFQNGNSYDSWASLQRLVQLPDDTQIYPAHDYSGRQVSTIGEERRYNPRLQVASAERYAELMAQLDLPNPKLMDIAVPANRNCGGLAQ